MPSKSIVHSKSVVLIMFQNPSPAHPSLTFETGNFLDVVVGLCFLVIFCDLTLLLDLIERIDSGT